MTRVHAAFTFTGHISYQRVCQTSQEVAQWADLSLQSVRAGVVDGWVILSARLNHISTQEAHAWLSQTLAELENGRAQASVFRLEIAGEPENRQG